MLDPAMVVRISVVVAALLSAAGCGSTSARNLKLDKELAHVSLEACLKAWKERESIESLRQRSPPIICSDSDWAAGGTLQSFKFVGTETDDGANLHSTVELALLDKYGRDVRHAARYVVSTSPQITVAREDE